ncbi:endonuclease/exonuclease/phosphatase family protein [Pseudopedobacter beijingensis]|uniref:Endonuclease/exonuclease/phosphatase family protein n=1 Tax=Pseudopedobacter beijingensis TaxID=1207056 RepID=A0ABW4IGB2_9SPHI
MKIITWNCNGAFRNKYSSLDCFNADVLVIQECENPFISNDVSYKHFAKNHIWIGNNKHKGLGIFAKEEIKIKSLDWSNIYETHPVNYFLPVQINHTQTLIAVWAHHNNSPTFGYIGQLWKYLQINADKLKNSIIIGDFNSNKIWDCWDRWWNHSEVVNILKNNGIESAYHKLYNENHGEEVQKTFFLHRNHLKAYHIDYCFLPTSLLQETTKIEIPNFENWKSLSDHLPLIIEY